jgi:hypothetical protein
VLLLWGLKMTQVLSVEGSDEASLAKAMDEIKVNIRQSI